MFSVPINFSTFCQFTGIQVMLYIFKKLYKALWLKEALCDVSGLMKQNWLGQNM